MELKGRYFAAALASLAFWWAGGSVAAGQTPTHQIKATVEQVRAILQDPRSQAEVQAANRRQLLREAIIPRFDFSEMARRSLGRHWKNLNGKREEFVSVFTAYLEKTYVTQIESFKNQEVIYGRERADADFAEVDTQVVPSTGEPLSIKYRMRRIGDEWKVYDLIVENVSIINNYRSQFGRFLARSSVDELLQALRAKGSRRDS